MGDRCRLPAAGSSIHSILLYHVVAAAVMGKIDFGIAGAEMTPRSTVACDYGTFDRPRPRDSLSSIRRNGGGGHTAYTRAGRRLDKLSLAPPVPPPLLILARPKDGMARVMAGGKMFTSKTDGNTVQKYSE